MKNKILITALTTVLSLNSLSVKASSLFTLNNTAKAVSKAICRVDEEAPNLPIKDKNALIIVLASEDTSLEKVNNFFTYNDKKAVSKMLLENLVQEGCLENYLNWSE